MTAPGKPNTGGEQEFWEELIGGGFSPREDLSAATWSESAPGVLSLVLAYAVALGIALVAAALVAPYILGDGPLSWAVPCGQGLLVPGAILLVSGSILIVASAILGLVRPSARAVGRRFITLLLQAGGASLRSSLRRDQLRYRARRRGRVYTVDFALDVPGFDRREVGVLVSRIASGLGVSDRYELHALPRRSSFSSGYSWRFSFDLKDRNKGGRHG